jgi:hypothetical protein
MASGYQKFLSKNDVPPNSALTLIYKSWVHIKIIKISKFIVAMLPSTEQLQFFCMFISLKLYLFAIFLKSTDFKPFCWRHLNIEWLAFSLKVFINLLLIEMSSQCIKLFKVFSAVSWTSHFSSFNKFSTNSLISLIDKSLLINLKRFEETRVRTRNARSCLECQLLNNET